MSSGPKEFLNLLCQKKVFISCVDRNKLEEAIADLHRKVNAEKLSLDEVDDAISQLNGYLENEQVLEETKETINADLEILRSRKAEYKDYEKQVRDIECDIQNAKQIKSLQKTIQLIAGLPNNPEIKNSFPSKAQLKEYLSHQLILLVKTKCVIFEKITGLEQYELYKKNLEELRGDLAPFHHESLINSVDQSLKILDENYRALDKRKSEQGLRSEINLMDPSANFTTLIAYRKRLNEIKDCSAETLSLRDRKLKDVESEIATLQKFIMSLKGSISELMNLKDADNFNSLILDNIGRYSNSQYQQSIKEAEQQVGNVVQLFKRINEIKNIAIENNADLLRVNADKELLSCNQNDTIKLLKENPILKLEESINNQTQRKEKEAIIWLDGLEQQLQEGASWESLKKQIALPPDFLPVSEMNRYKKLIIRIQAEFEKDVVSQIESLFRGIRDNELRQDCYKRLGVILKE